MSVAQGTSEPLAVPTSKPKHSFKKIVKAFSAFSGRGNNVRTPATILNDEALQVELDNAEPAEQKWTTVWQPRDDSERLVIADPGDGMWLCDCMHENPLLHFHGKYPFKHMKCGKCEHIHFPKCSTSAILTPIPSVTMEVFKERYHDAVHQDEARYCRLCRPCGLTHRAVLVEGHLDFQAPCLCGASAIEDGNCFYIGSVEEWRSDPNSQAVNLRLQRTLTAAAVVAEDLRSRQQPRAHNLRPTQSHAPPTGPATSRPDLSRRITTYARMVPRVRVNNPEPLPPTVAPRARWQDGFWYVD
ncbi:hypothetical protein T440DRAFT_542303 [Plenodomus tracheiphilus IPT5]|uniref:Probable double zinc ribbon domain-containing protein n=1 Tax=Plenodomus tracheiphilus IPT5 TaxID=1408161 RepID=A0A6A7BGU3_9PLEO|nr:hypothetical protein T440DRAFT_542303 [Plenodomus tracheiphilus IPT5]